MLDKDVDPRLLEIANRAWTEVCSLAKDSVYTIKGKTYIFDHFSGNHYRGGVIYEKEKFIRNVCNTILFELESSDKELDDIDTQSITVRRGTLGYELVISELLHIFAGLGIRTIKDHKIVDVPYISIHDLYSSKNSYDPISRPDDVLKWFNVIK